MDFRKKRWICLAAAFSIEMIAGIAYIWSIFAAPIATGYGWSQNELTFAYTLGTVITTLTSIFIGSKLSKRFSTRKIIVFGAVLFGGGSLLAGLVIENRMAFYLFQSVVRGMGSALIYPVLVAYSQQLFPEKTGFGSGVTTAGFGAGGIIWAPIATALLSRMSVDTTLVILGGLNLILILIFSFFITRPPESFKEEMKQEVDNNKHIERSVGNKTTKEMLQDPLFYLYFFVLCFGLAGGAMIISQARQILNFQYGTIFSVSVIGLIVSFISAGGTVGRFIFGFVSDKIGRMRTLLLASVLSFFAAFCLRMPLPSTLFVSFIILIVLVYGGFSSMMAPMTGFLFGVKQVSSNYPIVFGAFGVASVLGPMSTSSMFDLFGNYEAAFLIATLISAAGLTMTCVIYFVVKKRQAKSIISQEVNFPSA